jgi:tetratricopeptide (TPR) repeat protein
MALAEALERSGGDALGLLRQSVGRHPKDFWLNLTLANALLCGRPARPGEQERPKQPGAAVRYYSAALAERPEVGAVYLNLGVALMDAGYPGEAVEAFRQAVGVDHEYRVYSAVVGFYALAFERDMRLADDLAAGHRYLAARAAALAARLERGGGQGLRDRAAGWLRAELAAWTRVLEQDPLQARAVQQALRHWQIDPDFCDLRDEAALAELPEADRKACRTLWAEVATLLKRAQGKE